MLLFFPFPNVLSHFLCQFFFSQKIWKIKKLFISNEELNQIVHEKKLSTSIKGYLRPLNFGELLTVRFRIPTFQVMQLKILYHLNCCYLPLDFLKDWPSKLNMATELVLPWVYFAITKIKHLADNCSRIFALHFSLNSIQYVTNRILTGFNFTAAHPKLCETYMPEDSWLTH